MKNIKKYIATIVLGLLVSFAFAQTPPPPNNGNGAAGGGNNPVGGGAPVGSGLMVLMVTAGAYGYAKFKSNTPAYEVKE